MNPSIEVQITARLDKLDAALNVAQAKVQASADTMGKAGDQGGSQFVDNLVGKMVKGLAMGAITQVLGGGILTALQGVNAGKGGEQIGLDVAKGIVDGAKGIPIVGIFVSIFDEIINGANRAMEVMDEKLKQAVDKYVDSWSKMSDARKGFLEQSKNKVEDVAVIGNAEGQIRLAAAREKEAQQKAAEKAKSSTGSVASELEDQQLQEMKALIARQDAAGVSDVISRAVSGDPSQEDERNALAKAQQQQRIASEKRVAETIKQIDEALGKAEVATEEEKNKKIAELNKKLAADKKQSAEAAAEAAQKVIEELAKAAETAEKERVAAMKQLKKEELDVAMQAQQDIIDAESAAQAQIEKVGRVDRLAEQASQSMIQSGQTALGQFKFAQEGAGGQAMALAQKQVASLEKIETATAEQVRLMKDSKGFL
jgi:hypothetical protein